MIVPLLNEIAALPELVEHLRSFDFEQILFVDGGSSDGSWQWLQQHVPQQSIQVEAGRSRQMNAGAVQATAGLLLFLHADTRLPSNALKEIHDGLKPIVSNISSPRDKEKVWGRFNVVFDTFDWRMQLIAFFINKRSAWTGIATGDQAIFVRRDIFERLQGYADIGLMEDIDLSKRLKHYSRPFCSHHCVTTSARRWQNKGVLKTVLQMWSLRLAYFLGFNPDRLARFYRQSR